MSITSGAAAMAWGADVSDTTSAAIGVSEGIAVAGHVEGGVDHGQPTPCAASGWRLRVACTDGSSAAICPACGQQVGAFPDPSVGPGVWAIQEHAA